MNTALELAIDVVFDQLKIDGEVTAEAVRDAANLAAANCRLTQEARDALLLELFEYFESVIA